jgi:predicted nucleotidyltransferase
MSQQVEQTDHVMTLYNIARSLNMMHEEFGDKYPELIFILKSMEKAVDDAAAHFDGAGERITE